ETPGVAEAGGQQTQGAVVVVGLFAEEQIERLEMARLDLLSELVEAESFEFLSGGSAAHSPSKMVVISDCAKSLAMRSTAGFSSLKKDLGSSDNSYSPSNERR